MQLPFGFSPTNAIKQIGANLSGAGNVNYDVFSQLGNQRTSARPLNSTYYDSQTGGMGSYDASTGIWDQGTANTGETNPTQETPVSLNSGYDAEASARASAEAQRAQETADAVRAYNDRENALRGLLGRASTTRQQGMAKIGDEYNASRTTGLAGYDEQKTINTKDRLSNVDKINQKAQSGYNSLRRILGMSGSANQSAKLGIGQAVSRVASQDRAGAFDTAGRNERGIELAQNTFLNDLNKRKADAEYNLEQDIVGQEQNVYNDLATIAGQRAQAQGGNYDAIRAAQSPFQAEIDSRDSILSSLFEKYRPTLNTVAERPELSKFTMDRASVQANQQQPGDYSPYSQLLRRRLTETA